MQKEDKELENRLENRLEQQIVNDLPETVKEIRLGGSHVPLVTGNKCTCGEQIDLGSIRPNDYILITTSSGKEANVTLDMLEKGKKNKLFLFPGVAMEAQKVPRYPWMKKMAGPSFPIGAAVFVSGMATVLLSGERRAALHYCLGGLGLVSFMTCLLLKWTTDKTYWSMSLKSVEAGQTQTNTTPENGRNDNLSLSTKKEFSNDDGQQLLEQLTELKIRRPSKDLKHTTKSSSSTPSTTATPLSYITEDTNVNEDSSLYFESMHVENSSSLRKEGSSSSKKSHRRRHSHSASKKRRERRFSFRRDSFHKSSVHELIDPDDPKYADIPLRYKAGCLYDMEEAKRRWDLTVAWRKEEDIDGILYEEQMQTHFETIKEFYPHWLCGKSLQGHLVYYEQPGKVNMKALQKAGLSVESMIRYYIFICEVIWRKMDLREDEGKLVTVFDCEGIRFRDIWSEAMKFTKGASAVVQAHYVERCARIYVVNIPAWFAKVWVLVKPLVHQRTLEKVKIFRHVEQLVEEMKNDVDPQFIPVEYGGEAVMGDGSTGQSRWNAPEELEYCRIVKSLPSEAPNNQTSANGTEKKGGW